MSCRNLKLGAGCLSRCRLNPAGMNGRSRTPRQTSSKTVPRVVAPPPGADPCESIALEDSAAEPRSEELRRLRRRIGEQQDIIDKLAHEKGRLQKLNHEKGRKICYLAKKSRENPEKLKVQADMFRQAQDSVSFLKNYRSRRKNSVYFQLSRRGGCRLPTKRHQVHVGSEALAQQLEVRMSRQTVNRCERIPATVLEMSSDFHNRHYDSLSRLKCGEPLLLTFEVNGVRCDATNSIMLRHKAHVCEI